MVHSKKYRHNVDVWGLGVLLYEFLVGKPPFEDKSERGTYKKIKTGTPVFPSEISREAKDLMTKLLNKDPNLRLTLDDVLKHPWIALNCSGSNAKILQKQYGGML
mmetsp:Transcript_87135/g.251651  ORF Transcript_87135/g.251651 Transcript_87135/m.251651 type:complete len:105 (-) Transcript_87135:68-382(-)